MIDRIELDATSWIEHVTGWLATADADALLETLMAKAAWERQRWMVNGILAGGGGGCAREGGRLEGPQAFRAS